MDKDKEAIMNFISNELNNRFNIELVGDRVYRSYISVPVVYNEYLIRDFIILYRIDCLVDMGLITNARKNDLLDLFSYYLELNNELVNISLRGIRDIDENNGLSDLRVCDNRREEIYKQMSKIERIFNNYHLLDKIDLAKIIASNIRIDNSDLDINTELKR